MKKILKSLYICLGVFLTNQLAAIFIVGISNIFFESSNDTSEYMYIMVAISDFITLVLLHLMFADYDKKLLSKEIFKKIEFNQVIYISLFAIGITVILSDLMVVLTKLIPSYIDMQDKLLPKNNSYLQLIIAIILIPIYEEIIFRYVIFEHLKQSYNTVVAVIVQALVFGLAHGNIVQGIYTFLLGIFLAMIYIYSNSLMGSIILHVIFNLFGILIIPELIDINPAINHVITIFLIICLVISSFKIIKKQKILNKSS